MNALFIYSVKDAPSPAKPLLNQADIQFGISYLSSILKMNGHKTKLLVLTEKTKFKIVEDVINSYSPGLICFTAVFSEYDFIANIAKRIKERHPASFLIAGGPHVSLNPEECMRDSFDAICIGEGDGAILELATQLEKNTIPSRIQNLWIKNGCEVEKNDIRPFLKDLNILQFPDRGMWQEWIDSPKTFFSILAGRGCPYPCTYCCNHALRKIAPGNYVRLRSPDNILAEMQEITNIYPEIREIYLEVETFGVDMNWAKDLCVKIEGFNEKRASPLRFGTNLRVAPNMDLENLLAAMGRGGFKFINIGLESGSERVRRDVLKRYYSNEDIIRAVKLAKDNGIKVTFQIMIGIPGETEKDFGETIRITRQCRPDHYILSIFFPYPGTELYDLAKERGLIKEPLDTGHERLRASLDLPEFPKSRIISNYVWFYYNVYKGHRPMAAIIDRVFTAKIKSIPIFLYFVNAMLGNKVIRKLRAGFKRVIHKRLDRF